MADQTKMLNNLKKLAALREENPLITHIYMRRPDGESRDIPIAHADYTIRQNIDWDVEDAGISETKPPEGHGAISSTSPEALAALESKITGNKVEVPGKPSEEKIEATTKLSRVKLEELAKAEGCTDEEIVAAEDKAALVELVNAKRTPGSAPVGELTSYTVLVEDGIEVDGKMIDKGEKVELDADAPQTKEWLDTNSIETVEAGD